MVKNIEPETIKFNFRQSVGLTTLALGALSIAIYTVLTGRSFFTGLTPGLELLVIVEYLFLFTSFFHKVAMVNDNRSIVAGTLSILLWILIFVVSIDTPYVAVDDPATLTLGVSLTAVIFIGWLLVDLIDVIYVIDKK